MTSNLYSTFILSVLQSRFCAKESSHRECQLVVLLELELKEKTDISLIPSYFTFNILWTSS